MADEHVSGPTLRELSALTQDNHEIEYVLRLWGEGSLFHLLTI
jgi:hypothetical protein